MDALRRDLADAEPAARVKTALSVPPFRCRSWPSGLLLTTCSINKRLADNVLVDYHRHTTNHLPPHPHCVDDCSFILLSIGRECGEWIDVGDDDGGDYGRE